MRYDPLIATSQNNRAPFKPLRFEKSQQGDSVLITGYVPHLNPFDRCLNRIHEQLCVSTKVEDVIEDAAQWCVSIDCLLGAASHPSHTLKSFRGKRKRPCKRAGADSLANRLCQAAFFNYRHYLENFFRGNSLIKIPIDLKESLQPFERRCVEPTEIGLERQDRVARSGLSTGEKAELQSEKGKQSLKRFIAQNMIGFIDMIWNVV